MFIPAPSVPAPSGPASFHKLAILISQSPSGQPVQGLEVLAAIHLPTNIRVPLGKLVTDHAGYVSFDLTHVDASLQYLLAQHLRQFGSAPVPRPTPLTTPGTPTTPSPRSNAVRPRPETGLSIIVTLRTVPGQQIDILEHGFGIIRNAILAELKLDAGTLPAKHKPSGLVSIQRPSLTDWAITPTSFALNPTFFVGQNKCENLYPANFTTQEFRFHQILRDTKAGTGKDASIMDGWALEYQTIWNPLGHTLGNLVYTLPLAPGEITNVAIIDWSRKSTDSRFDDLSVAEQLVHNTHRDRTISETVDAALAEWQRGGSVMGGAAGALGYSTGGASMGASAAIGGGYSTSSGDRNVTVSTVQQLSDGFSQASSAFRELRSTVVIQSAQSEHAEAITRVVANYNHAHTLTILYYEVLRHYEVVTEFVRTRHCLLVSYASRHVDFNDDLQIEKYQYVLRKVLLDRALVGGLDLISKLVFYRANLPPSAKQASDYQFTLFQIRLRTGDDGTGSDVSVALRLKDNNTVDLFFDKSDDDDKRVLDRDGYGDFGQTDDDTYLLSPKSSVRWGDLADLIIKVDGGDNWRLAHVTLTGMAPEGDVVLFDSSRSDLLSNNSVAMPIKAPTDSIIQRPEDKLSEAAKLLAFKLRKHLQANAQYYNRAIWLLEDPNERAIRFAATQFGGKPLLDLVDNRPLDVLGDHVAFPSAAQVLPVPDFATFKLEKLMTLPTRGVFADAKLGHCSAAEIIDNTRFWDWQSSPIPEKAPAILPVSTDSRNVTQNTAPAQMPSAIVNIVAPSAAPDPTAMSGALGLLGKSDIFRNMSMAKEVADLLGKLSSGAITMADASKKAKELTGGTSGGTGNGSSTSGGGGASGGGASGGGSAGNVGNPASNPQQLMDWTNAIKNSGLSAQQKAQLTQALVDNLSGGASSAATLYDFQVTPAVPFVKQPTADTCWAAAATMLRSWKAGKQLAIEEVMDQAGPEFRALFDAGQGLEADKMSVLFENLDMRYEQPASYTIDTYSNLLHKYGPLWLTLDDDQSAGDMSPHAFILVGMKGDGTAERTTFLLMDPSAAGQIEYPFTEVLQKFEEMSSANPGQPLFLQIAYNRNAQVGAPKPYDRDAAVAYAQTFFDTICSDHYLFSQTDAHFFSDPSTASVTNENDCTHFISCCIGLPPRDSMNQITGGGLFLDPAGFFPGKVPQPYGMTIPNALLRYLKMTNKIKFMNDQGGLQDDLFYHETSKQALLAVPFADPRGDIIFYSPTNQVIKPGQPIDFHHAALIVGVDSVTNDKKISCHTSKRFDKPLNDVGYAFFVYARIIK